MIARRYCENITQLSSSVADFVASQLRTALYQSKIASLVIPGGNTPKIFLPALARLPLQWEKIVVTLSDERWVSADSEDSNENLLQNYFFHYMENKAHFISLKTDHDHPSQALSTINQRLSQLPLPINLTILGLGEDGHIASIFPGSPISPLTHSLCEVAVPPIAPSIRISLAFPLLISSHQIIIVVIGENKRKCLEQFINSEDTRIPFVRLVQQTRFPITIFESN